MANTGYHFVGWSDGIPTATRTDSDVTENLSVSATFAVTPPVADAGPDVSAVTGSPVQLTGAASTAPSGRPLSYAWTQVSGASVTLSDPAAVSPTFTAPNTPGDLTFGLVVSDGIATSVADTVLITVSAPPVDGTFESGTDGASLAPAWTLSGAPQQRRVRQRARQERRALRLDPGPDDAPPTPAWARRPRPA